MSPWRHSIPSTCPHHPPLQPHLPGKPPPHQPLCQHRPSLRSRSHQTCCRPQGLPHLCCPLFPLLPTRLVCRPRAASHLATPPNPSRQCRLSLAQPMNSLSLCCLLWSRPRYNPHRHHLPPAQPLRLRWHPPPSLRLPLMYRRPACRPTPSRHPFPPRWALAPAQAASALSPSNLREYALQAARACRQKGKGW